MDWDEEQPEGQVELETGLTPQEDGTVELFWRVTNDLEHPILLLTPLSALENNELRATPVRVYAYVDPEGVLHMTKRLWPVPEAVDVFFPEVPFATEVPPGEHVEERIVFPLPIQIDHPYRAAGPQEKRGPLVAEAQGFVFSIGYLVEAEGRLHDGPVGRESGAPLVVTYGTAARFQRILQGGMLEVGVPVKE